MDNKYLLPFVIAGLTIAFGIISFLVFFSGKNPYFIKKKLQVGALLISLTAVSAGCRDTDQIVTCYDPALPDQFMIDQSNRNYEIKMNYSETNIISGNIKLRDGNKYSFAVMDKKDSLVQIDNIYPSDGAFDENTEEFVISLNKNIPSGSYFLRFYSCEKESISNRKYSGTEFTLIITGNNKL